jgi:three-Cys-motif partner protein
MPRGFFQAKRSWSRYKDLILGYYLEPYLPKVASLGKPVLIVDACAGRGTFEDGADGSPLIIAKAARKWRDRGKDVRVECIEADPENFAVLEQSLCPYREFVTARLGSFEDRLDELAVRARDHSVFLYIDPYTVKALAFDRLQAVYHQVRRAAASVEVLLNLNVPTFLRWALAMLKAHADVLDDEADYLADDPGELVEVAALSAIAGGDYWLPIAQDVQTDFAAKVERFTAGYLRRLTDTFAFAAACGVKESYTHRVPKYVLVYATRHGDGAELMNDAMCQARRAFLGDQFSAGRLFDVTPTEELPDTEGLRQDILAVLRDAGELDRKSLRQAVLPRRFGQFRAGEIDRAIGALLQAGCLASSTGKKSINDTVVLRFVAQRPPSSPRTQALLFE